ncbi:hypothetical protein ACIQ6R_16340 [Streptomyces sp. NPDC096048]|uniref:hypothetical protein n=1 Tax=Streptomyces sp. NPDC096048 TaxID=3366072 RepID=UPI00381EF994
MNTKRVNSAAGVIHAAQVNGKQTATGLAADLESACMLQDPETAKELAAFRALELGDVDGRVSATCGKPHHPTWLRAVDDTRGCPWCEIDAAHEETIGANLARWEEEQDTARLRLALKSAQRGRREAREVTRNAVRVTEQSVAELKREHAANTGQGPDVDASVDKLTRLLAPTQALREPEQGPALPWAHGMSDHDLHGFLDQLLSAALGRWQHSPEVPDRVTLAEIEKVCALWRTPGEGNRLDGSEFDGAVVQLAPQAGPEQGACTECGDGPSKWCVGCAKCSCEPKHDKGCMYASTPR